jgi:hypothetical protein
VNSPVTKLEAQDTPAMKDWVKRNFRVIVEAGRADIIKKKGLWLITKTFSAKERAIAVMKSRGSKASFNITVGVPGQAKVHPAISWWKSSTTGTGWIKSKQVRPLKMLNCTDIDVERNRVG